MSVNIWQRSKPMEKEKKAHKEEKKSGIRDTLYGRIDLPVKSVDRFIVSMLVLLVVCIVLALVF